MRVPEQCKTCIFRARRTGFGAVLNGCDYILLTGKPRGCAVEHCGRYMAQTAELTRERYSNERKEFPLAHLARCEETKAKTRRRTARRR